jgi:photosystem II stability/assembly factor-like uncharacterized protein
MPLIAQPDQTNRPRHPARPRRAAASALAALAVAGPLVGCAAASSGSAAAGPTSSGTPAGTATAAAGSGSTPTSAASPGPAASGSSCGQGQPAQAAQSGTTSGGSAPALAAIQFTDADHGWVAGAGRIMATTDGGSTWSRQYDGPAALDQVDFLDADHGWAAGAGTLLRTVNGGATWTTLTEPCQGELSSIHFVSPALGYAVAAKTVASTTSLPAGGPYTLSAGGTLMRTTDGGATWSPVAGTPANPQSACFASQDDGYLGTPGSIWRTTDGGQHWTLALAEPKATGNPDAPADTPDIECAGPSGLWALFLGQGAATGHAPYLAYASENGQSWHGVLEEQFTESALRPSLKLPEGPGSYPGPISAIDPGQAVFVGYTPPLGYGAAPVMLASDNGAALTKEGDVATINEPMAAAFLSPDQGWVVGENLHTNAFDVEATSDAGRTWTTQYTTG